jgi:hypothetical protein
LELNRNQTIIVGLKGQGELIMRILRMRLWAIGKVFDILETKGTLGIKLGANSTKGDISITLGDMMM